MIMPKGCTPSKGEWIMHPPEPYGEAGWQVLESLGDQGGYETIIGEVNCQRIRVPMKKQTAELICRAVNSHATLVNACRVALDAARCADWPDDCACSETLIAALALAERGQP